MFNWLWDRLVRKPIPPRKERFDCLKTATGIYSLRFFGPTCFETPSSWKGIQHLSQLHKKVLLLSLYEWSNYSYKVINDISDHQELFEKYNIGLAAFCPGDMEGIDMILPDYYPSNNPPNNEPFMFVIEKGSLIKSRFGPLDIPEIIKWVIT